MDLDREIDNFTDDEDFNELINLYIHPRRPRRFRNRVDHFEKWDDEEFLKRFRLSKQTTQLLINELTPQLEALTNRNHALSPTEKLLATLRYLATGSTLQMAGDFCGFEKGTSSRVIYKCLTEIARLRPRFIKMPNSEQEITAVKQGFYNISRFPQCVGALDCTHIRIQSPGGPNAELFRNRKGFFSYNVQAVCDSNLLFRYIVCRWQGSAHDSTIFSNSRLRHDFENEVYGLDSLLVGDSGYPIRNYLITPLLNPRTPAEHLFNEAQVRTRNPIERNFGIWKRRFPILSLGIKLHHTKVEAIVVATAVLHNIAILAKDELPPEEERFEAAMLGNIEEMYEGRRILENETVRFALINQYFQNLLA